MLFWHFSVSGVDTWLWLPPLVAFVLSFFCAMGGISGAFLLLPFQMSVLGFAGPAASATNLVFNLFATPGGIWRYLREGRLFWPLAAVISLGSLPGIVLGFYVRVLLLPDAARFKLFAGMVLLYLSWRLLSDYVARAVGPRLPTESGIVDMALRLLPKAAGRVRFLFQGQEYGFSTAAMGGLAFAVGILGGTYGIGGGAIIAPFCIAVFRLPIHAVAGAALAGTFVTSLVGVVAYTLLPLPGGGSAAPDWSLGALFGLGGMAGMYLGAACQKFIPQKSLKGGLGVLLATLGAYYLLGS